ncbi:MAG: TldD/PmbA family protein [Candidatus Cloacimonetes bacterium]|nr:TldD/PmbA family protein [Candidatus Cloacimonadota bacterium]
MISVENTKEVFKETLSKSENPTQVILSGGKQQLARIGKNTVYQNMLNKEYTLKVQVADYKKVGNASTNRFYGEDVEKAIHNATFIARHQAQDPDWEGFLNVDDEIVDDKFYCKDTMDSCFEEKLEELNEIFIDAKQKNVEIAGAFSHGDSISAIGNQNGMFRYHVNTDCDFTFSIMTPNGGTGWSEFHSHRLADINPKELYRVSLEKALLSENPIEIDGGEYTVILEPPAVQSLLFFLGYAGFGGLGVQEKRSFFSEKFGEKVFGDNISISDNFAFDQSFGAPFDYDGIRKSSLNIMDKGVFNTPVFDRVTARKMNKVDTGHALPYPSRSGPLPLNLCLSGGESSVDEMVKSTKKGILVTRFFYDNLIDPGQLTLTGMTRDGTFLIEDGKLVSGIKNMRYNESLPRIFNSIIALSKQCWSLRGFGRLSVPAIKVEGFSFSS